MEHLPDSAPLPEALREKANSEAGKQLLKHIRQNTDPAFQSALKQASSGDYSRISEILHALQSSPETAALIDQLRR